MPTLSRLLDRLSVASPYGKQALKESVPETPSFTTYALWTPLVYNPISLRGSASPQNRSPADARAQLTQPALRPTAKLSLHEIPPGAVLYALTAPDPSTDARTSFLLDCLPDPLGWLAHCALFIRNRLSPPNHNSGQYAKSQSIHEEWRHSQIHLIFEHGPGLAATSGGTIKVSMQWVGSLMAHVRDGGRSRASATREIKGVLLHELVHAIQYDGRCESGSTAPSWLVESIADFIRLQAHLGPPHWRKAGQGREIRGWEDGYDAGARFFAWLEDWVDPSHGHGQPGGSKWAERERERVLAEVTLAARLGTVGAMKGKKPIKSGTIRSAMSKEGNTARPTTLTNRPSSGGSSSSGSGSGTRTPTQASTSRASRLSNDMSKEQPSYVVLNEEDDVANSSDMPEAEGISRTTTPTQASIRRTSEAVQQPDLASPKQQMHLSSVAKSAASQDDEGQIVGPAKSDGPWPGVIAQIDQKLRVEAYSDGWWAELTGVEGGLEVLWARYLGDYRT